MSLSEYFEQHDYHGKVSLNYQITFLLFIVGSLMITIFTGFVAILVVPLIGILGIYTLYEIISSTVRRTTATTRKSRSAGCLSGKA